MSEPTEAAWLEGNDPITQRDRAAEVRVGQCNHWNDRLPEGVELRPIRCTRTLGHEGRHAGGGAAWTSDLGYYWPKEWSS